MGEFADLVAALRVRAHSPDGRIFCEVAGPQQIEVAFPDNGYYEYLADRDLADQLGRLASVAFSRYRREYEEVLHRYRDYQPAPYELPADTEFRERQAAIRVSAVSPQRWIEAESRGLARWDVRVEDGARRALTQGEFLAEVGGAVSALMRDWRHKVIALTDKIYSIGTPRAYRQERYGQ